jgi:CRP-like cAMP-binding protein
MTHVEVTQALRRHPFTSDLTPFQIANVARIAEEVVFPRNHVIFRERDSAALFYLLLSGRVAIEVAQNGTSLPIQTLHAGDELGWSAVLESQQKVFQARTLEPVRALAIRGPELRQLLCQDYPLGYNIMKKLLQAATERLQGTQLQLLDMYAPGGGRVSA